jgi:hypothetical protein
MKRTESVELFGRELLVSQRSIKDIIDASKFARNHSENEDSLFVNCFVVYTGLKINLEKIENPDKLPWYKFFKKLKLKKEIAELEEFISVKNLMNLSIEEVLDIADKIHTLDYGLNGKKKVEEVQV